MRKRMLKWAVLCMTALMMSGCADDAGDGTLPYHNSAPEKEAADGSGAPEKEETGGSEAPEEEAAGGSEAPEETEEDGSETPDEADNGDLREFLDEVDPDRRPMIEVYLSVLEGVYYHQIFPNDRDFGYDTGGGRDVSDNHFTVYDVDFDGEDELVIHYWTTCYGNEVEIIYGFDSETDSLTEELEVYPSAYYYDNGVVLVKASHNDGLAGDLTAGDPLWPYSLYQYDKEEDCYHFVAHVDSWSKEYSEESGGTPFPDEVDVDGDGRVHFIKTDTSYYDKPDPIDGAEYEQWRSGYLDHTERVKVSYMRMTKENIRAVR